MLILQRAMGNHGIMVKLLGCSLNVSEKRKLSTYLISTETVKNDDAEMITREGAVPLVTLVQNPSHPNTVWDVLGNYNFNYN